MSLQFFLDKNLVRPMPTAMKNGRRVYQFRLPMNQPGNTVKSRFYVYNDSHNVVADFEVASADRDVSFTYESRIAPLGKLSVDVSWHAPLSLREALVCYFTVKANNIIKARI